MEERSKDSKTSFVSSHMYVCKHACGHTCKCACVFMGRPKDDVIGFPQSLSSLFTEAGSSTRTKNAMMAQTRLASPH